MKDFTNDIPAIVDQLSKCGFECEAGPIINNEAFIALQKMALDVSSGSGKSLPFDKKFIQQYLDDVISQWRRSRDLGSVQAQYYIDAYQSIRSSIIGETLPETSKKWDLRDRKEVGVAHTVAQDFEHFLAYSQLLKRPADEIERLRTAYEAAWEPSFERMNDEVVSVGGKLFRLMSDQEHVEFTWGKDGKPADSLDIQADQH